jgi:hypothetical protein
MRGRGHRLGHGVTTASPVGHVGPSCRSDRAEACLGWPAAATAGLPVSTAMAGGVQPRGPDGVELPCLVCGAPFMALRLDRRTCSSVCARRDRVDRAATRLQRVRRACQECGRVFVAGRTDKRFCSPVGRNRARGRARPHRVVALPCVVGRASQVRRSWAATRYRSRSWRAPGAGTDT